MPGVVVVPWVVELPAVLPLAPGWPAVRAPAPPLVWAAAIPNPRNKIADTKNFLGIILLCSKIFALRYWDAPAVGRDGGSELDWRLIQELRPEKADKDFEFVYLPGSNRLSGWDESLPAAD